MTLIRLGGLRNDNCEIVCLEANAAPKDIGAALQGLKKKPMWNLP
jgi:hypothetical protein